MGTRALPLRFNGEKVDLHDTIVASHLSVSDTFHVMWRTDSIEWKFWDEEAIEKIGEQIRYDFEFERYEVEVVCISGHDEPCSEEGNWEVTVIGYRDDEAEAV